VRASVPAASIETLAQQGGPMAQTEAEAFAATPTFADAGRLRRCGHAAKDLNSAPPNFAAYRPLLRRLILAQLLG